MRRTFAQQLAVTLTAATVGSPILLLAAVPASAAGTVRAPLAAAAPNQYLRNCSYLSLRCTPYRLTNPPLNPRVPSIYRTKWVWTWI